MNYGIGRTRNEVTNILLQGLRRLEYRGYDSAGLAIDGPEDTIVIVKSVGPVSALAQAAHKRLTELVRNYSCTPQNNGVDHQKPQDTKPLQKHVGLAHTRWATHGPVCERNSHPHTSSPKNEFVVVHNGIITNYKEIKAMLEKNGYKFESDTDTEVIAKLCLYFYNESVKFNYKPDFKKIVLKVTKVLVRLIN